MKQKTIINAYNALTRLYSKPMSFKEAYKIFTVRKKLENQVAFQTEKEKEIFEKYSAEIQQDGNIKFTNQKNYQSFLKEMNELGDIEVELEIEPATVDIAAISELTISPEDIEFLDGFVSFE